jgi:hypothetical protein
MMKENHLSLDLEYNAGIALLRLLTSVITDILVEASELTLAPDILVKASELTLFSNTTVGSVGSDRYRVMVWLRCRCSEPLYVALAGLANCSL